MSILSVMICAVLGSTIGAAAGAWLTVEWLVGRETRRGAQRREVYARHRARLLAARRTRLDLAVRAGDSRVAKPGLSGVSAVPDRDAGVDGDPTGPVVVPPDVQRRWKTKLWPKSAIDRKRIYFTDPLSDSDLVERADIAVKEWVDAATDERQAKLKAMQTDHKAYLRGERADPRD